MDKAHARAVEALQPFIHLANANSATSPRFVANLITNATSNPHTYVFGELLETSTIQSLSSLDTPPEYKIYLKLLEIFAWGTWEEYENYQGTPRLPELSFEQAQKLRLLSLLSLAKTIKPLTYSALMTHLSLKTPGELESLVTTAIYSSLLTARLSPAATPPTINVTAVAPLRDVQPQSLPAMISVLEEWQTRCGNVVSHLETEIQNVKLNAAKRAVREAAYQRSFDEALEKRKAAAPGGGVAGVGNAGGSGKGEGRRRGRRGFWGMGNKREADDIDHDDGFFDAGEGMDIDEGAGATGTASGRGIGSRTKRILAGGRQG
ncbi:COP9 signalosome complex subunit 7 [Penicillium longicatenatum]|uniref:COP9 signalosome complex subunit 7 n=1 Tax=Penicillium longicatenatum TaxID=1561947 RepID=UPI002546AC9E|nr:COP9 signalosome complex subunit 7 [Penicillium longicatenatum]KAJ5631091.1 COP9 signalosome complex subunit 7 [Penicillium longicatenatum]